MFKKLFVMLGTSLLMLSCIGTLTSCGHGGQYGADGPTNMPSFTFEENVPEVVMLAYTKAQDLGFDGALDEFLALCKGADGKDGVGIADVYIEDGDMFVVLSDKTEIPLGNVMGTGGKDGVNGKDGKNGKDGIGIAKTEIDENGNLVVYYTDDLSKGVVLGPVVGKDGEDAIGIANVKINEDGVLVIYYTDKPDEAVLLGKVICENHTDGSETLFSNEGVTALNYGKDDILRITLANEMSFVWKIQKSEEKQSFYESITMDENKTLIVTLLGGSTFEYGKFVAITVNEQQKVILETQNDLSLVLGKIDLTAALPDCEKEDDHTHAYSEWVTLIEASCREGLRARKCADCGETEVDLLAAVGHKLAWVVDCEPTCMADGQKSYRCIIDGCNHVEKSEVLEASAHDLKWVVDCEPTCMADGQRSYRCIIDGCNHVEKSEVLEASAHDLKWVTDRKATCTAGGQRSYRCVNVGCCYFEKTESLRALGHSFANDICVRCGHEFEYENPILFHTPVLDGILDDEYLLSYKFDNPQYSEYYVFDEEGNGIFDAWSNRSTTYALWDGEYVYIAVELFDDDMIQRSKAYTQWEDSEGDVNPYYNDCAEVWFCFELMEPSSITDVRKICYDAFGVGDGPFTAVSEGIYSEHFLDSSAAAKAEIGYAPDDEQGYKDRAVIEFKIPAKMESGDKLLEGDYICYSIQISDIWPATDEDLIAGGFDPETFVPVEEEGIRSGFKHSYTRARTHFPEGGELNGYAKGTLTMIRPTENEG